MKIKLNIPSRKRQPVLAQYPNQCFPQTAYLELDPVSATITADYSGEVGNAVPSDVWHSRLFRVPVAPEVSRSTLQGLRSDDAFLSLVTQLIESWDLVWNGNNYVGKHDADTYNNLCHYVWIKTSAGLWDGEQA
jgi:hypothetical protein